MLGNPGQGNYVGANGNLEGLARQRRAEGRPALTVGFGAIADKGYLTRKAEVNEALSKRVGKSALQAREVLQLVEIYMKTDGGAVAEAAVAIAEVDWAASRMVPIALTALFASIMRQAGTDQTGGDSDGIDLKALIASKSEEEAQAVLHGLLAAEIAAILRITEDNVTLDKVLKDISLDSLMAMELGMSFEQKTGFDIPLSGMGEGTTVCQIVSGCASAWRRATEPRNRARQRAWSSSF
jgi:acyl carrier protein